MSSVFDELLALLDARGDESYGESVTIRDHLLLTAHAAREAGFAEHLVAAGLFHDVGHLIAEPDDWSGVHDHGDNGGDWVLPRLGSAVAQPVRLHIEAKRYLCATEPGYWDSLSEPSQHTLAHQGGPHDAEGCAAFEQLPGWSDAVALRRLEDALGKVDTATVPDLASFRPLVDHLEAATASQDP